MSDVVSTFRRREACERRGDERVHVIKGARSGRSHECFEFRECHFDRIEVGTVRGQEAQLRTGCFNRRADLRLSMDGEVVEDDDVARV